MPKIRRKVKTKARQNPTLLLAGVFGLAGVAASIGAYFLKGTTQETMKVLAPSLIGGSAGYLTGAALTEDKTIRAVGSVLGLSIGYLVGNAIQDKKLEEACSGWKMFRPSCIAPSIFGSPVQSRSGLFQLSDEKRAQLDQAAKEASDVQV